MEVAVLGPVEIRSDDGAVSLGPRLQRLLAILVARAGTVVSTDLLIDAIWSGEPPAGAERTVRTYVTRLRGALGDPDSIAFRQSGYSLDIDPTAIDSYRFEQELDDALRALKTADLPTADRLLNSAIGRWTGRAYGGFGDEEWARPESVRLEERRCEAGEALVEVQLARGDADHAVAAAGALVEQHPLRERPRSLLMRSLYASGRQAEAVRVYRDYRRTLGDETGLEPSRSLADLESEIVRGELTHSARTGRARGYDLGEELGRGAFAVVHRAVQPGIGRDVAVKIVRAELADLPEFVRRFEHEAQLIAAIEHPHVVPLYDFWREPGAAYLVMRWLRGGNLADHLRTHGPLSRQQVMDVLDDIGEALHAAHRAGVVHGDVHPGNLLRDADGANYLSDFGIARASVPVTAAAMHYTAPELLRGGRLDVTADVLSLGVTTFELFTGRLPFADTNDADMLLRRQLGEPLPRVSATRTDLPMAVDDVLATATAKAPEDRFPDVPTFVAALGRALEFGTRPSVSSASTPPPNPYVGLHTFTEADADRFFGRERLIGELVDAVEQHRMVVVVGPSGSGKSSVVRAGLVPSIRRGGVHGSEDWFITTMVPGADPIERLEAALLRVAVNPPASLRSQLDEAGGLLRAVRRILPDDESVVLVVVDQFEELFTVVGDDSVRSKFLDELAHALTTPGSPLRIVATLRADHYDAPLQNRALADLVAAGTVAVRPMQPDELERAIAQPARSVGVEVEFPLAAHLLSGVLANPAALPLLQFALTELFERRGSGPLTLNNHFALGGLTGAVANRAEAILERGEPADEQAARALFARLVRVEDGIDDAVRRRATLGELAADERTSWLIDAFVDARLLAISRDGDSREPTIEVTHESLLRDWPRLRRWLEEDRDDVAVVHRVAAAAAAWDERGRDDSELARGGRLAEAEALQERRPDVLSATEREWVEGSRASQRRRTRRLRQGFVAVAVLAVFAIVGSVIGFVAQRQASASEQLTDARRIVAEAENVTDDDPELAILLALAAIETFRDLDADVPAAATDVVRRGLIANRVIARSQDRGGRFVAVSPDGTRMASMADVDPDDGVRHAVDIWDLDRMEVEQTVEVDDDVIPRGAWFVDGSLHLVVEQDRSLTVLDQNDDRWVPVVAGLDPTVDNPLENPEYGGADNWLAGRIEEMLMVWDTSRPAAYDSPAWSTPASSLTTFGIDPARARIAYAIDGTIVIRELDSGRIVQRISPDLQPGSLAFSPDGTALAILQRDEAIAVHDIDDGAARWPTRTLPRSETAVWSTDGQYLLVGGEAGISLISAQSGSILEQIQSAGANVFALAGVPGSTLVVAASIDGGLAVIDLDDHVRGRDVIDHYPDVLDGLWLELPEGGARMVLADGNGVEVVDTGSKEVVHRRPSLPFGEFSEIRDVNTVTAPVLSLDGEFVGSADEQGWSQVWSIDSGDIVYQAPAGWDVRAVSNGATRVLIHRNVHPGGPAQSRIVDVATDREIAIDAGAWIMRGHFTPDGSHLLVSTNLGAVQLWDTANGAESTVLDSGALAIGGQFDISDDGRVLAVASFEGTLVIIDLAELLDGATLEESTRAEVPAHNSFVLPVAVSTDGRFVGTIGQGGALRIWNSDGERLAEFPIENPSGDGGVGFHPTEPWVYVAQNGTVTVHTLDVDELVELAHHDVQRDLSDAECRTYLLRDCDTPDRSP